MSAELEDVARWIRAANFVACVTGAGISTDSGIPDFRGPNGLWTRDPEAEKLSNIHYYVGDPEIRKKAWRARLEHPAWTAKPNAAHRALAAMELGGKLHALITQNIDGLHQKAGSSPETVIEMHGTLHDVMCLDCGDRAPMQRALDRVRAGEGDPECRSCGGILKSATVSFGQALDPANLERAEAAADMAEVLICAGSTLTVTPVAYLPQIALTAGAKLVVMNAEPTPYDRVAHAVLREPLGESLPRLAAMALEQAGAHA